MMNHELKRHQCEWLLAADVSIRKNLEASLRTDIGIKLDEASGNISREMIRRAMMPGAYY
jgi:uncharacterized protein CbrC (UPF0167 family)